MKLENYQFLKYLVGIMKGFGLYGKGSDSPAGVAYWLSINL